MFYSCFKTSLFSGDNMGQFAPHESEAPQPDEASARDRAGV
jgi:hypothetical protein